MSSLEEEFEYHAHIISLGKIFDPLSLPFDFESMSQEQENSGIQISDLSGLASLSKEAREFLGSIFGPLLKPAAEEIGELLADKIRQKRAENWIKVLEKSSQKAKTHNLEIKPANLKILTPIMDHSSIEQNEEMQDRWSNLLLTETTEGGVHPSIPKILNEVSSTEASILELMYKSFEEIKKTTAIREKPELQKIIRQGFLCSELREKIDFPVYLIDNLIRLNLCQPAKFHQSTSDEAMAIAKEIGNIRGLTSFKRNPDRFYIWIERVIEALGKTIYKPHGEQESITLTALGFECVKAWSDPTSDTSSQTSAS